jgi:two-component system, LuxR family, response regulator FixJ
MLDGGFLNMIHGTVFIVDDDADVRCSLQCVLQSDTRRVAAYACANDFLADFQYTQPSCLLLDLRLPGTSGEVLLEYLRSRFPDLPVIVISGHADVPTVLRTIRGGAVDFCTKPLELQVLIPMIDRELAADAARADLRRRVAEARQRLAQLTPREKELFELVVAGKSYKEMAATLGISPRTVEHHRAHIIAKIGVDRVADMVRLRLFAGEEHPVPSAVESPYSATLSKDR